VNSFHVLLRPLPILEAYVRFLNNKQTYYLPKETIVILRQLKLLRIGSDGDRNAVL